MELIENVSRLISGSKLTTCKSWGSSKGECIYQQRPVLINWFNLPSVWFGCGHFGMWYYVTKTRRLKTSALEKEVQDNTLVLKDGDLNVADLGSWNQKSWGRLERNEVGDRLINSIMDSKKQRSNELTGNVFTIITVFTNRVGLFRNIGNNSLLKLLFASFGPNASKFIGW